MGTSAGFVPTAAPECPYVPRMTRAAALALRAGAGLLENCVVVITDGPVIGTVGNTSPTEVELNPTSPTEFGLAARVHTTFAASAWPGVYDIDANAITELTDDFGNTAKDIDATATTVHTQWPWHLGSASLRDNYAEDATIVGLDTQVGPFSNNRVIGGTITLTGKTAGSLLDNEFTSATLTLGIGGASALLVRTKVNAATINHTGTGSLSMTDSDVRDGFIIASPGASSLTVSDSRCYNHGTATADINNNAAAGSTLVNDCEIEARVGAQITIDNQGTAGNIAIARCRVHASTFARVAGVSGSQSVTDSTFDGATISQTAGAAAAGLNIGGAKVATSTVTQNGPAPITLTNPNLRSSTILNAATATRGLVLQTGDYKSGTVNQNRTGGAGVDSLTDVELSGQSVVTLAGAVDPGMSQTVINRSRIAHTSAVTITDPAAVPVVLQNSDVHNSTVTMPAGVGLCTAFRVFRAGLNMGAFAHSDVIIDGPVTKVLTAANVGKLCNLAFDNTI